MSGHAILDSCHNCGAMFVPLFIVSAPASSEEPDRCTHPYEIEGEPCTHHIHVVAACRRCKESIWEKS